jgi:hypothetical protein
MKSLLRAIDSYRERPLHSEAAAGLGSMGMDYSQVLYDVHGQITVIAIKKPEMRSCIGPGLVKD